MDNWLVGRFVESRGNRIDLFGLKISVDSPGITTRQKSTLFYGRYEVEEQQLLRGHLDPALPVIELGGCIGVVSCTVNRMLEQPTRHVVVEANPQLVPTLEENRRLNDCSFTVVHQAVAYGVDAVNLSVPGSFVCGNVTGDGETVATVPATKLSNIALPNEFERFTLIMDIEGAEVELVEHDGELLAARTSMIIAEFHPQARGADRIAETRRRLEQLGFEEVAHAGDTTVLVNRNLTGV
jgi:FkbM family methyltransferase